MQIQKFTSRNTKTEILKAYNELAKAYRDLESAKPASPTTTALVKSTPAAAPAAPARVDGLLSVEDVIAQLSRLSERGNRFGSCIRLPASTSCAASTPDSCGLLLLLLLLVF